MISNPNSRGPGASSKMLLAVSRTYRTHRIFAVVALLLITGLAHAQIEDVSSSAVACLSPPAPARDKMAYPEEALRAGVSGVTEVLIQFTSPTEPPEVKVLTPSDPRLARAVVAHVSQYRVPCLRGGSRAQLRQEFVFAPNPRGKVSSANPVDVDQAEIASCVTHMHPGTTPVYPTPFLGTSMHAIRPDQPTPTILARLQFTTADGPPLVDFPKQKDSPFTRSVEKWAREYRFPCYSGATLEATQWFRFRMEGEPDVELQALDLVDFLGHVDLGEQKRFFDLDTLQCPFDVQLEYRQPLMANKLREFGAHATGRQPLLDWLSTLRLEVSAMAENQLLGSSMKIKIPCGKIDL